MAKSHSAHTHATNINHNHAIVVSISDSSYDTATSITEPDDAISVQENSEDESHPDFNSSPKNQLGLPENRYWGAYNLDGVSRISRGGSVSGKGEHLFERRDRRS